MHALAAGGLGVVASMHLFFLLRGLGDPSATLAFSALGFAGAAACAWALLGLPGRAQVGALAGGVLVLFGVRAFYFFRGFDGYGLDDLGGTLSVGGLLVALASAGAWALRPGSDAAARAAGVRLGFGVTAAGYFVTMVTVLSAAGLSFAFGLLLGAVGFSLAAPNVQASSAERAPAATA